MAVIGGIGVFGSSIGAQTVPVVVEPVSVDEAVPAMPVGADHSSPALSDTGAVVAFDASDLPDRSDRRVWIRDRTAGTTTPVVELVSAAPGMSGNGCLVAYSVPGGNDSAPTVSLTVVDRCATSSGKPLPAGTVIDKIPVAPTPPPAAALVAPATAAAADVDEYAAPALSFDGSTIVWSTGSEIRRYVRPAPIAGGVVADHLLVDSFDLELTPGVAMTGADVDISDDGTAVVFVAGPGATPYAPDPGNVYVWSRSAAPATPTIELLSMTTAGAPGAPSSGSPSMSADGSLVVFDSTSADLAAIGTNAVKGPFVVMVDRVGRGTRVLVDEAERPAVSGDGRHVAYERGVAIRMLSSTDGTLFTSTTDREVNGLGAADPITGLVLSRFGRWIVFDSAQGAVLTSDVEFQKGAMVWAADLRASDDGSVVDTTTTTTTPTTPTTPTTTIVASNPPTVTTTTVAGAVVAPPVAGALPPATTVPLGTVPPPRFSSPPVAQFPRQSSGSSGSTFVQSSAVAFPFVQPGTVVFEPTVAAAGRRTETVSLSNPAARTAVVVAARVDAAGSGAFSLVADNCTGQSLTTGATCTVDVQFAPLVVGTTNGLLTFDLADGSAASASLVGEGSAEPTLDVVPGVAAPGQVVTVFGAGFPGGATVEISRSGVTEVDQLAVDPDGTFAHVFVVLPNTPSGPMTLMVAAQPDLFGDVSGELLVSSRRAASTAVFRNNVGA